MKTKFLLPGDLIVVNEPAQLTTLLGSCIAVAIRERGGLHAGMNHYLLPDVPSNETPSTRYGAFAIPELIEQLLRAGASRRNLEAKVFGGGAVLENVQIGTGIGQMNAAIAMRILGEWRIPILETDVGGNSARKIRMDTTTFEIHHFQGPRKLAA